MKKISFLLALFCFLLIGSAPSSANIKQDTTASVPSDLDFTTVGSEEDTAGKNEIQQDTLKKNSVTADSASEAATPTTSNPEKKETLTLWQTFVKGLFGGFLGFFMPCIFPMVPLTVSYFMKKGGSRKKGIMQAIIYGLSIIVIYVAVGLLITVLFGSAKLNELSSSGTFNILFFVLLVVFAISFFGAFEITLPSSFVLRYKSLLRPFKSKD